MATETTSERNSTLGGTEVELVEAYVLTPEASTISDDKTAPVNTSEGLSLDDDGEGLAPRVSIVEVQGRKPAPTEAKESEQNPKRENNVKIHAPPVKPTFFNAIGPLETVLGPYLNKADRNALAQTSREGFDWVTKMDSKIPVPRQPHPQRAFKMPVYSKVMSRNYYRAKWGLLGKDLVGIVAPKKHPYEPPEEMSLFLPIMSHDGSTFFKFQGMSAPQDISDERGRCHTLMSFAGRAICTILCLPTTSLQCCGVLLGHLYGSYKDHERLSQLGPQSEVMEDNPPQVQPPASSRPYRNHRTKLAIEWADKLNPWGTEMDIDINTSACSVIEPPFPGKSISFTCIDRQGECHPKKNAWFFTEPCCVIGVVLCCDLPCTVVSSMLSCIGFCYGSYQGAKIDQQIAAEAQESLPMPSRLRME